MDRIEWNVDMDEMCPPFTFAGLPEIIAKPKGRCQACWGGLLCRMEKSSCTGIKCRVCKNTLEGLEATKEYERILEESTANLKRLSLDQSSIYKKGLFAIKIFPDLEKSTQEELEKDIAVELKKKKPLKDKKITRHDFPDSSPSLFLLQAEIMMNGVEHAIASRGLSIADFPNIKQDKDGSITQHISIQDLNQDPLGKGYKVASNLGVTMIESMNSAFACELAMKAICMTCKHKAIKDHDLFKLFRDLPVQSRKRIEADYPDIEKSIKDSRHIFSKWRYFEEKIKEKAFLTMIDTDRARTMSKAARIILDEAEVVGLRACIEIKAKQNIQFHKSSESEKEKRTVKIKAKIKTGELPPKK